MRPGPQLYLKCEWCDSYFKYNGGRRNRWCSNAHKQAAWREANDVSTLAPSTEQVEANLNRLNKAIRGMHRPSD